MQKRVQEKGLYVFVPAYNEEKTLGNVLRGLAGLKKRGIIQGILVVDDGSTDRTGKIAESFRKAGVEVVHFKRNFGKAYGFYYAAKWAQRKGAELFGMFDADLNGIPEEEFRKMLEPMKDPQIEMVLGEVYTKGEKHMVKDFTNLTGQRIIRMKALKPLLIGQKNWLNLIAGINKRRKGRVQSKYSRRGYGLEIALNYLIGWRKSPYSFWDVEGLTDCKNVRVARTEFKSLPVSSMPERRVSKIRASRVLSEPTQTYEEIERRANKANMLKEMRKRRSTIKKPAALKYAARRGKRPRA